jgi:hypothetical protein
MYRADKTDMYRLDGRVPCNCARMSSYTLTQYFFPCRHLSVQGLSVDLRGLRATSITQLVYWSYPAPRYRQLKSGDIAIISSFNALKRLELFNWKSWDDLTPLKGFPLEALGCANTCMLFDILALGFLHTLKSITFPEVWTYQRKDDWLIRRAVSMVTVLITYE